MMKVYKVFLVKKIENLLVDFISVQKIILLLYETMFVGALMKCSDYLTHKEQNRSYLAIKRSGDYPPCLKTRLIKVYLSKILSKLGTT